MGDGKIIEVFECNICTEDFKSVEKFDDPYKSAHIEKLLDDKNGFRAVTF